MEIIENTVQQVREDFVKTLTKEQTSLIVQSQGQVDTVIKEQPTSQSPIK